ncbi:cell death protein 3-like [Clavelina lepadiformis]|uniref:cell death protein 3-like n=1 Tax=Clavelina lepadiformis TaxID=159417 RepID=UPI0040425C0D
MPGNDRQTENLSVSDMQGLQIRKTTNLSDQTDTTYFTEAVTTDDDVIELEGESSSTTPSTADVIKCLATSHGFVSFRNTHHGSWFIQNFVDVFNTYVEDKSDDEIDFLSLMMVVAKKVASKSATDKCGNIYKQMPCVTTTLQKRIVFPKAKDICHVQSPVGDVKAESNDKSNPTVSK